MKPVIAYDADGVLLDFMTPALHLVQEMTGIIATPLDISEWDMMASLGIDKPTANKIYDRMKVEGYGRRIPAYPGAVEHIAWVKTWADVHIVTSPMNGRNWHYERDQTFVSEFGLDRRSVHHIDAKYLIDSDALVEDKTSNLEAWIAWGWTRHHKHRCAMLMEQSYNGGRSIREDDIIRVGGYNQIETALRTWFKEAPRGR
jgi:5'(3')-deoxyribonucleotidase